MEIFSITDSGSSLWVNITVIFIEEDLEEDDIYILIFTWFYNLQVTSCEWRVVNDNFKKINLQVAGSFLGAAK